MKRDGIQYSDTVYVYKLYIITIIFIIGECCKCRFLSLYYTFINYSWRACQMCVEYMKKKPLWAPSIFDVILFSTTTPMGRIRRALWYYYYMKVSYYKIMSCRTLSAIVRAIFCAPTEYVLRSFCGCRAFQWLTELFTA